MFWLSRDADHPREHAVYVEELCVTGLGRTRLAKSVHEAGRASFAGMLAYEAARYGRTFGRVDPCEQPTTGT